MKVQLEAARLLVYKAATLVKRSRGVSLDASIAKLFVSEALVRTALETQFRSWVATAICRRVILKVPFEMPLAARFILVPGDAKKTLLPAGSASKNPSQSKHDSEL